MWNTADAGLEVPTTPVHIREDDDADPKVLAFLMRKPWYARIKSDAVVDAKLLDLSSVLDSEGKEVASSWIMKATTEGEMFYFNTLTGVSKYH